MSPRPSYTSIFASAPALVASMIALSFALPCSVWGQNYADRGPGVRVTQASEGMLTAAGGEVTLKTETAVVAGRPQFRYLPGSNGDTVLTADFEGLTWNYPTKIIRLNSPEKALSNAAFAGIKEIRIGQFQASPSVLRVSFVARDPAVLKKVAIGAAPGVLKLSWKSISSTATSSGSSLIGANNTNAANKTNTANKTNAEFPSKAPSSRLSSSGQMPPLAGTGRSKKAAYSDGGNTSNSGSDAGLIAEAAKEKAPKGGWLARLRSKTKEYFSEAPEVAQESKKESAKEAAKTEASTSRQSAASINAPVAPAIAQSSPAAARAARIPVAAPAFSTSSNSSSVSGNPNSSSSNSSSVSNNQNSTSSSQNSNAISDSESIDRAFPTIRNDNQRPGITSGASSDSGELDKPEVLGPPPLITLETADPQGSGAKLEIFRVERPDGQQLNFKSFRLHNPERYVVDMPDYRELANSTLPDVSTSPLVSSMRVGLPGEAEGAGRLVLQLTDDTVSVDETFNSGSSYMTVTLAKGLTGNAGIARNGNLVGSIAGGTGPILVPRAPSETVIVLDAGHGGSDPGAVRGDVQEKEVTLQIIAKLKKVLEGKGARIVLTRGDDTFISLEERVRITNAVTPNLFLSVHINSLESTSNIYGIETYFQTDQSRPLADRVHASLVSGLGAPDRSVRKARFYVINHTPVPAILAEVGYITNKQERDRLISSDYQQKVASALARGVMLYLQDVKSRNGFANNSAGSVSSSTDSQQPSKLAAGSWKPTK
ncbi:MAG: N-acetylmuramoyl-L-alanine amidase [Candidatus Obscuribacterales bacterium]